MLSILSNLFRSSGSNGRWDPPGHWRKRGPRSDWDVARDEWERNRRNFVDPTIR